MRKNFKWLPFIALFSFYSISIQAQINTINISVAGIEYDDAGFTKLKESVKSNTKVSDLKQTFSESTAKLTLKYTGEASSLWDEVPASIKQPFKIITIDNGRIELQLKNAPATSTPPATASSNNDDCKNCYWNYCVYDVLKSFEGKIYRGINKDDATHYYNCDNGVLVHKIMTVNGYGVVTAITTDTILISNGPIGTKWSVSAWDYKGDGLAKAIGLDLSSSNGAAHTLIAKGITTTINGKTYKDVIVVNDKGYSTNALFGNSFYSTNYYYAKGVGLIRTDTLNFQSDPVQAINKTSDEKTIYSGGSVVKDGIDESIVGTWKSYNTTTKKDGYYKLNGDGTFDYYEGGLDEASKWKGINHWKIEPGGYDKNGTAILDIIWESGKGYINRYELTKKNDPATGKPAILWNGYMLVSADNKKPW